jgi:hypothetical protein
MTCRIDTRRARPAIGGSSFVAVLQLGCMRILLNRL